MYASVVRLGVHVLGHVIRLRIAPQDRIVIGGPRRRHRPQRLAIHLIRQQTRADEPVGVRRRLIVFVLLDHRPKHVRNRFIEGAGLPHVNELRRAPRNAMCKFVSDHVQGNREAVEQLAVPIAEHHLVPIPERIVVGVVVVDSGIQWQTLAVDGNPMHDLKIEIEGGAEAVVGFIGFHILRRCAPFRPDQPSGKVRAVARGVDRSLRGRSSRHQRPSHVHCHELLVYPVCARCCI